MMSSQCRYVHKSEDQCAYIRANCVDEEAGLVSYLQLYYCRSQRAKPVAFIILVLWLGLLFSTIGIAASDFFCINLSTIASILGMSESMAGVTFLAFGNGSPDVFSTFAAMKTHSGSLAVGELIGAAGFITAVVAGSMALVRPFKVARKSFVRDVGFFIVAASFSMVFLADGHLHLWECAVMVGFYVFYVITVVFWHWYLARKRRHNYREAAARGHFQVPGSEETEVESYLDDDEEVAPGESNRLSRGASADDFANLERGGSPMRAMDEDEDDETREHYMAEISSNMRVSRPRRGERRNTVNPIRPSLVGALEFRAVLSSLQKSRNIQTIPINLRRYSDDPTFTMAQQQEQISSTLAPESSQDVLTAHDVLSDSARPSLEVDRTAANRVRAVSANDASGLRLDPTVLKRPAVPDIGLSSATPPGTAGLPNAGNPAADGKAFEGSSHRSTPALSLSPVPNDFGYFAMSPSAISYMETSSPSNHLAPPDIGLPGTSEHRTAGYLDIPGSLNNGPPTLSIPKSPRFVTPRYSETRSSSPASPFPEYFDDPNFRPRSRAPSLRLPPPSVGSESTYHQRIFGEPEDNPVKWWPYRFLPPPQVLTSTLFPTLYSWTDKNIWEKLLGIIAAPSVLLLSITLPIVETDKEEDDIASPGLVHFPCTPASDNSRSRSTTIVVLPPESSSVDTVEGTNGGLKLPPQKQVNSVDQSSDLPSIITSEGESEIPTPFPHAHRKSGPSPARHQSTQLRPETPDSTKALPPSSKEWNRWLIATQIFTAPLFIVVLVWANTDPGLSTRNLLLPILYALISSLIVLVFLLFTTSASKPPRYRYLLCFLGFIVSIAWISNIANEVVGVLKAFGVILGISDAILGLTIFAVGNSLGDLVADMTVAKLGYPVMALSACFGGPMLNILLGIGLSGLYMTIKGGKGWHERHPTSPVKYKPYQLEISGTLVISGVTLLVTLLGLLVVVPMNGWKMDRRIGWGLLALWTASTIGNVVVEVLGWG